MAHLRRRPKHLPIDERITYVCELTRCPACGTPLQPCQHLSWTKTVQHLDRVVVVASRPKECPNPACAEARRRYPSAAAQTVALPHSTYGLDVLALIGWYRDHEQLDGTAIYERLRTQVQISRRHVDVLTQHYRLLLAAAHRPDPRVLAQVVHDYGGLLISLDGLEPEGAQEQLWVVREGLSGTILAVGWLPRVNATTLATLLAPVQRFLAERQWPVLATVSDKQAAVVTVLQATWPDVPHQWCQAHYLRNAVKPIHDHDHALQVDLRREVRQALRASLGDLATATDAGPFSPSGDQSAGRPTTNRVGGSASVHDATGRPAALCPGPAGLSGAAESDAL